ncbi:MAG: hypothetical protein LUQ17_01255 [Methanomicrobiales archaeon]|nr:hypothetical protein [Methanomicrobiales archaeon]
MNISEWCPVCDEVQELEVLKEGKEVLVECTVCRHIQRIHDTVVKAIPVKTIVSAGEGSQVCSTDLERDGVYMVGDPIAAECGEELVSAEITGIEREDRRVERAKGYEIRTLWTRAVQEVTVKISVHEGRSTIPLYLRSRGEEEFEVNQEIVIGRRHLRISHIKLRNDRFMRRKGERASAKAIKRIYAFPSRYR